MAGDLGMTIDGPHSWGDRPKAQSQWKKSLAPASLVVALALIIAGLIATVLRVLTLQEQNRTINFKLREHEAKLKRLETLVTQASESRTQHFPDPDREALRGLTRRIKALERQVAATSEEKATEATTEVDFVPLEADLRAQVAGQLSLLREEFARNAMSIQITYETWVPSRTRQFTKQLAGILAESDLEVIGPGLATVYRGTEPRPLEWGYNHNQIDLVNDLHSALTNVIRPSKKYAKRSHFPEGHVRIHFAGTAYFDEKGRVLME